MHEIAERKGAFTLFGLFLRANAPMLRIDEPDTWDLVVSAPWLDMGTSDSLGELIELVRKSLGTRVLAKLAKFQIIPGDDPGLKSVLRRFAVEDGELLIKNEELFGLEIERAILFRAWPPARVKKAPRRKRAAAPATKTSRVRKRARRAVTQPAG